MKKLISIAIMSVFALFLTACGGDDNKMESGDAAQASSMRAVPDNGQKADDQKADDMKKMKDMKDDMKKKANGVKDDMKNVDVDRGTTSGEVNE